MDDLDRACTFDSSVITPPVRDLAFVGIDSGLKGFLAIIVPGVVPGATPLIRLDKTPTFGPKWKPTSYNLDGMLELAHSLSGRVALAFIEKQQGYRENGHQGNFKTGFGYGLWMMALRAAKIPVEELYPQQWKAQMGILPPKAKAGELKKMVEGLDEEEAKKLLSRRRSKRSTLAKDLSRQKATMLFPSINLLRTGRCTVPDDNLCEALLLAEMSRRLYAGR